MMLSYREASRRLGVAVATTQRLVASGVLPALGTGVDERAVEELSSRPFIGTRHPNELLPFDPAPHPAGLVLRVGPRVDVPMDPSRVFYGWDERAKRLAKRAGWERYWSISDPATAEGKVGIALLGTFVVDAALIAKASNTVDGTVLSLQDSPDASIFVGKRLYFPSGTWRWRYLPVKPHKVRDPGQVLAELGELGERGHRLTDEARAAGLGEAQIKRALGLSRAGVWR